MQVETVEQTTKKRRQSDRTIPPGRRFGSEHDVERLTGIKAKTLQKHRLFGKGFPFYRVGSRILYDLTEIETVIRNSRVRVEGDGGRAA